MNLWYYYHAGKCLSQKITREKREYSRTFNWIYFALIVNQSWVFDHTMTDGKYLSYEINDTNFYIPVYTQIKKFFVHVIIHTKKNWLQNVK